MGSLEQLLQGPLENIYDTKSTQIFYTPTPSSYTSNPTSQQSTTIIPIAHAAPGGSKQAAPSQKELVELYNSISGRWVAESYDMMNSAAQQETYSPEGTWGLSVTSQSMSQARRIETTATLQLNRDKQEEAPIGWEVSSSFGTNSGHFISNIDQDGISVRCFTGIGSVSYQGSHQITYTGEEDSVVHTFGFQPIQSLTMGYKYQASAQGAAQVFSAATKVDTIGVGLETTFAQQNIFISALLSKKWYLFPTPDVRRGDDATSEMQQAQRLLSKSQITTTAAISNTGDITLSLISKYGYKAMRDFALWTKIQLAQGKVDVRGATSFLIFGRRLKLFFDQNASFTLSGRTGVWGDSNLDIEGKFEFNPIQLYAAGQMPVLSAKLNWNIPVPQDAI